MQMKVHVNDALLSILGSLAIPKRVVHVNLHLHMFPLMFCFSFFPHVCCPLPVNLGI